MVTITCLYHFVMKTQWRNGYTQQTTDDGAAYCIYASTKGWRRIIMKEYNGFMEDMLQKAYAEKVPKNQLHTDDSLVYRYHNQ